MDKLGLDYGKEAYLMSKAKYWKRVEDIIKATQESRSMSDMDIMLQDLDIRHPALPNISHILLI